MIIEAISPYKYGIIRKEKLEGIKQRYESIRTSYNKYPRSRRLLLPMIEELRLVIKRLEQNDGYYDGRWVNDSTIDGQIKQKADEKINKQYASALASRKAMTLTSGKS